MTRKAYPSDMTDEEWEFVKPILPGSKGRGRPRTTDLREVVNAILYIEKTGVQWGYLPRDFPPKSTVWDYFKPWRDDGTLERILEAVNKSVRVLSGREEEPSTAIVDSQSVKSAHGGEEIGTDGYKKVHGRKRHIVTDILGLVFAVIVTSANVMDGKMMIPLIEKAKPMMGRLAHVEADGAYGMINFKDKFKSKYGDDISLHTSAKDRENKKFEVQPIRWRVERTIGWFVMSRRLSKDYEKTTASSEAWVYISAIRRTLKLRSRLLKRASSISG